MASKGSGFGNVSSKNESISIVQAITGLNRDDASFYLEQYNWKVEDLIKEMDHGKKFFPRTNSNRIAQRSNYLRSTPEEDQELANLCAKYGAQDEEARRQFPHLFGGTSGRQNPINSKIYHEKQKEARCGLHALNNLFQMPNLFTVEELDSVMNRYNRDDFSYDYGDAFKGDYDLRVLVAAIEQHEYFVHQITIDQETTVDSYPLDSFLGLLVNRKNRHWFAIKEFDGVYYNLDSVYAEPEHIGNKDELIRYLAFMIECWCKVYIFAVTKTKTI